MANPDRVAYQGAPGAFSEDAARLLLGDAVTLLPLPTLIDVFDALAVGRADGAIVPVENSLAGAVPGCAALMAASAVTIVGECELPIEHALIGLPGTSIEDIELAHSHPVALAQCVGFFRRHPRIRAIASFDTSGAVEAMVAAGCRSHASIASRRAAGRYGAAVLAESIQDSGNVTRFLHIEPGVHSRATTPGCKTSIVCTLRHEPGALCLALQTVAAHGLNLTRIESVPQPGRPFEYAFLLDVGPTNDPSCVDAALKELARDSLSCRVIGHYATSRALGLPSQSNGFNSA